MAWPQGSGLVLRLPTIDPRVRELKVSVHLGSPRWGRV